MKDIINLELDYCYDTADLKKNNIIICEPSSDEIRMATEDMIEFLENKYELLPQR